MAIPILLLKTKSSPTDGYDEYFSAFDDGHYRPQFIPVLEHTFNKRSLSQIEYLIVTSAFVPSGNNRPRIQQYGGIILTSQRAVEAFVSVITKLRQQDVPVDELLPSTVKLYVVGPATARSLRASEVACSVVGEQSGSGDALALFILDHYNTVDMSEVSTTNQRRPLLFLVGEQRRDIIPRTLQHETLPAEERVAVDELTVYETRIMETFPKSFKAIVESDMSDAPMCWVVVFSATGCRAMLEILGLLDWSGKFSGQGSAGRNTLVATIGPTTRDYLVKEFDFEPDACADRPSPDGVGMAIQRYMNATIHS